MDKRKKVIEFNRAKRESVLYIEDSIQSLERSINNLKSKKIAIESSSDAWSIQNYILYTIQSLEKIQLHPSRFVPLIGKLNQIIPFDVTVKERDA